MPYLLIARHNGVEFVSVVRDKHREVRLGEFEYVEITDEQFDMSLAEIEAWYRKRKEAQKPPAKMKKSELLRILSDIILQSHHEGERENAKALYLKYAGKPFEG